MTYLTRQMEMHWGDALRLFISYSEDGSVQVDELASELERFGVKAFVAHLHVPPGENWEHTITTALETADAFAAYCTRGFARSRWCNQEVGWAKGRDLPIVTLMDGAAPKGFIARYQGIRSARRPAESVAFDVACALCRARDLHDLASEHVLDRLAGVACELTDEEAFLRCLEAIVIADRPLSADALQDLVDTWIRRDFGNVEHAIHFARFLSRTMYRDRAELQLHSAFVEAFNLGGAQPGADSS